MFAAARANCQKIANLNFGVDKLIILCYYIYRKKERNDYMANILFIIFLGLANIALITLIVFLIVIIFETLKGE